MFDRNALPKTLATTTGVPIRGKRSYKTKATPERGLADRAVSEDA